MLLWGLLAGFTFALLLGQLPSCHCGFFSSFSSYCTSAKVDKTTGVEAFIEI
jgi:hypothetical protein